MVKEDWRKKVKEIMKKRRKYSDKICASVFLFYVQCPAGKDCGKEKICNQYLTNQTEALLQK